MTDNREYFELDELFSLAKTLQNNFDINDYESLNVAKSIMIWKFRESENTDFYSDLIISLENIGNLLDKINEKL